MNQIVKIFKLIVSNTSQMFDCVLNSPLGLVPVFILRKSSQPAIACSKLIIETLEQGVKSVQS